jgi:hypothetical protein
MKPPRHNPLFYTKTGELDTGQFVLLVCCAISLALMVGVSWFNGKEPSIAAWAFFGSFTTMCFIAGAAKDRARLIANSKTPGQVGHAIASAKPANPALPAKTDDERADSTS